MTNTLRLSAEQLAAIVKRSNARLIDRDQRAEPHRVRDALPVAKPRKPKRLYVSESVVMRACMDVLESHPYVALWWRNNTGAMQTDGRFIRFSFKGASDLMGVLRCGKFVAVECKATGKRPSSDQEAFLWNVSEAGAHAICLDDAGRLKLWLDGLQAGNRPSNAAQDAKI